MVSENGEITERELAADEFLGSCQGLRRKCWVAEWRPPTGIKGLRSIAFLVLPTETVCRFELAPPLNGWSGLSESVARIAFMGYWWLRSEAKAPADELDQEAAELFLHFGLMPWRREFRRRRYKKAIDYRLSAKGMISLMPEYLLEPPVSLQIDAETGDKLDPSTVRKRELHRVTEPVFGEAEISLLEMLALWQADAFDNRRRWAEGRIRKAVLKSLFAAEITAGDIERARAGPVAKLFREHVTKVGLDDKDMLKVFRRIQRQGYRDLWARASARGMGGKRRFTRDVLCLMAGSFWTVSRCWTRVMTAVSCSIRPRLGKLEELMFARLHLPQRYVAGLAPLVLWPRKNIVHTVTLRLLETPQEESWRFNAIPYCLRLYGEMDDVTRLYDRRRKRHNGREVQFEKPEDLTQPSSAAAAEADLERLRELFHRQKESGPVRSCPNCDRDVENIDFTNAPESGEQLVKLIPCGCVFPVSS